MPVSVASAFLRGRSLPWETQITPERMRRMGVSQGNGIMGEAKEDQKFGRADDEDDLGR